MASIETIVNVQITKGTRQVSQAGFGVGLILAVHTDWADRVRVYGSYADVADDMTNAAVLAAAQAYFSQDLQPTQLVIGKIASGETPLQGLQAVQAVNNDWYALICLDHDKADVLALAGYIETQKKIFGTSSQDPHVIGTQTDDVATGLSALNYARTFVLYSGVANSVWPEAAWLGRMLPTGVGAATWKFKTLVGVASDDLSGTALTNAQNKKANVFIPVGGVDITSEGIMASGEYIDVTRFIDWLQLTMESNIYGLLVNSEKIPYTNKGIAVIENAVRQTLQDGIANGGISNQPVPAVSVPDVLSVSSADKASRTLNNVVFTCTLAGAIHKVNVQGFVSV
jgi:hypothetical protein